MSVYHMSDVKQKISLDRCTIDKMLVENEHLIETITAYQKKGRVDEATRYQQLLHRNIILLARLADKKDNGGRQVLVSWF